LSQLFKEYGKRTFSDLGCLTLVSKRACRFRKSAETHAHPIESSSERFQSKLTSMLFGFVIVRFIRFLALLAAIILCASNLYLVAKAAAMLNQGIVRILIVDGIALLISMGLIHWASGVFYAFTEYISPVHDWEETVREAIRDGMFFVGGIICFVGAMKSTANFDASINILIGSLLWYGGLGLFLLCLSISAWAALCMTALHRWLRARFLGGKSAESGGDQRETAARKKSNDRKKRGAPNTSNVPVSVEVKDRLVRAEHAEKMQGWRIAIEHYDAILELPRELLFTSTRVATLLRRAHAQKNDGDLKAAMADCQKVLSLADAPADDREAASEFLKELQCATVAAKPA
jgi:hypothetical protein